MRRLRFAFLCSAAALLAGCGTVLDTLSSRSEGPRIYGGVRLDMEQSNASLVDLPFSFAADTALLPLTVLREILVPKTNE